MGCSSLVVVSNQLTIQLVGGPPTSFCSICSMYGIVFGRMSRRCFVSRFIPTTALTKPCQHCQGEIRGMPSELQKRKFCSKKCVVASWAEASKGKRKVEWATLICQHCQSPFEVTPAWVRNGRRKWCSKRCHALGNPQIKRLGKAHTDESRAKMAAGATWKHLMSNSSQWRGGRYKNSGYILVMVDLLTPAQQGLAQQMLTGKRNQRYILEHRLVAAVTLGRVLLPNEVVHHLNGVKDDNRSENLVVVPRDAHSMQHRAVEQELRLLREQVRQLTQENTSLKSKQATFPLDGNPTSPSTE